MQPFPRSIFLKTAMPGAGVETLIPVLEMRDRDGGVLERLGLDENSLGRESPS